MRNNPSLRYFYRQDLTSTTQLVADKFHDLAGWCTTDLPYNKERDIVLRKLLEAQDAAIRCQEEGWL